MGYKKDSIRQGGCLFSLRASHPLFSLQSISLFLPDCPASFLFLYTLLTFWCQNLGGKIHRSWVGSSPKPTSGGPHFCQETEMNSGMGLSTCLAGLTSTHWPTFHPSVTRVSEIPFSWILCLSPHFQVLGARIPTLLGPSLVPCLTLK